MSAADTVRVDPSARMVMYRSIPSPEMQVVIVRLATSDASRTESCPGLHSIWGCRCVRFIRSEATTPFVDDTRVPLTGRLPYALPGGTPVTTVPCRARIETRATVLNASGFNVLGNQRMAAQNQRGYCCFVQFRTHANNNKPSS